MKLVGHILRLNKDTRHTKTTMFWGVVEGKQKWSSQEYLEKEPSKKTLAVQAKPQLEFQVMQMTDNVGGPFLPDVFLNAGGNHSNKVSDIASFLYAI